MHVWDFPLKRDYQTTMRSMAVDKHDKLLTSNQRESVSECVPCPSQGHVTLREDSRHRSLKAYPIVTLGLCTLCIVY